MSVQQVFDPALQENPVPQNDFTMFQNISVATSTVTLAAANEFDQYLSEPTEPTTDPTKWWWNRRHRYPALSTNALDFLSIPATSTASERVFSRGRQLLSFTHNRLSGISIRHLLCLEDCSRHNIVGDDVFIKAVHQNMGNKGKQKADRLHSNVVGNVPSRNKPAVIPVLASRSVTPTIKLFEEQQMAYNIVTNHVLATKDDRNPEQLLMFLLGFGGTGKTVTINTISQMFRQNNVNNWITVIATSGVATTLIQGVTVHFWGGIHVTDKTKKHEDPDVLVMKMSAVEI
ncbi:hypothetical protein C8J56DRAFT_901880 [Mycena floridula]|nr:hypothetical protein C8J56DRAFT_901880 [Mycena floridula]